MKHIVILILFITFFSCSKEKQNSEYQIDEIDSVEVKPLTCDNLILIEISDQELFDLTYSPYKYYNDFYTEDLNGGSIYFENTVSVYQDSHRILLCTDNYDTAFNWSEMSSKNSAYYRELESTSENDKYFEFRRVDSTRETDIVLHRVFKCSYIDCSEQKKTADNIWEIGTFNQRPFTLENCMELVEFWNFISSYNIADIKIISREECETKDFIQIILFKIKISYGDWDTYDKILLVKSINSINKANGLFTLRDTVLRQINGKFIEYN